LSYRWQQARGSIFDEHVNPAAKIAPGKLDPAQLQGGTATGPAAGVSVAAGGEADVEISISFPKTFPKTPVLLLGAVGPLPTGILLGDLERTALTTTGATVTLRVYNYTAAAVTMTAGSVKLDWLALVTP